MKLLRRIMNIYLYGSVHIGLGAMAMTWQTFYLLKKTKHINPEYLAAILCSTIAFYSLNRLTGLEKLLKQVNSKKHKIIAENKIFIITIGLISLVASLYIFLELPQYQEYLLLIGAFITLFYAIPLFKKTKKLREFSYLKIFLIAFIWALVTALIPAWSLELDTWGIVFIFLERSLFIFALTLPFDIRDLKIDSKMAVRTIPSRIGTKNSILLSIFCLVLVQIIIFLLYLSSYYQLKPLLILSLSNVLTGMLIYYSKNVNNDYYYTALLDGVLILQPLFLLII